MTTDDQSSPNEALRRQAKDWVVHVATGEVTQADLRALERWRVESPLHAEAYAQACKLWGMLESPLEAIALPADPSSAIRTPIKTKPMGRRACLGGRRGASAAAAAGIMIVSPPFDL